VSWRTKLENGSSLRAIGKVHLARSLIGDLASRFLLKGDFEHGFECAEAGLAAHPNSVVLHLNRAHALMFLGSIEEARAVYRRYWGKKMPPRGNSCSAFLMKGFYEFRRAGLLPPLMDEVQQWFLDAKEAERQSAKILDSAAEAQEPSPDEPVAVALPPDIERGDQLLGQREFAEALASYRRGLVVCNAKILEGGTDLQAQRDSDLIVGRIGDLAFALLRAREAKQAVKVIEEAQRYRPGWLGLRLIHAHALMLSGQISGALNTHRNHYRETLEGGDTWGRAVSADLAALGRAGFHLPIMDHVNREFGAQE
jgi:tetratricopeptide (TPR) repeat protein